jgi:hypothetical protein
MSGGTQTMTVNSYPISDRISRRAGDDDPSMILNDPHEATGLIRGVPETDAYPLQMLREIVA